ncbi:hypothetical protein LOK49_LG05G03491 [Camellia lanceoleosa]|uniref:Uncharacterized protein n=1 Tax=Camellia lanceoleosa TaxID=1840588 RepID=A0ACC0HL66_9ERIC|nr:hypothetical protein LOK49_LG05G03491 [Camellia lanceoleosa]
MDSLSTCGAPTSETKNLVSIPSPPRSYEISFSQNIPNMSSGFTPSLNIPQIPPFGIVTIPRPNTTNISRPFGHSLSPSLTHSGLPYYVTEPSDSPTSQDHSHFLLSLENEFTGQNGPSGSTEPTSEMLAIEIPRAFEILLSSVFTGLSLKRKALEEPIILSPPPKLLKLKHKPRTDLPLDLTTSTGHNQGKHTGKKGSRGRPSKTKKHINP